MKILSVGQFDPCGVAIEHRDALRAAGFDYRMLVQDTYSVRAQEADWIWGEKGDPEELLAFIAEADVVQFYPGISQPESFFTDVFPLRDADTEIWPGNETWPTIDWDKLVTCQRVFYFHGSRNTWAHKEAYARRYGARGALWASTIDYATLLGATLAPPIVGDLGEPTRLRRQGDPLIVAHAPTDPKICHTDLLLDACRRTGVIALVCTRMSHDKVLVAKRRANVGFDHLRGCFSVNTLENAAMGLAPLVGLNRDWEPALEELSPPPCYVTEEGLEASLAALRDSVEDTQDLQQHGHHWYHMMWKPRVIARLRRLYEELA